MADDTNVTDLPGAQQQGKRARGAKDILGSIKGKFKEQKAKEFENAAQVILKDIDLLEKNLALKNAELEKLIAAFEADQ